MMFRASTFMVVLAFAVVAVSAGDIMPAGIVGTWTGVPRTSILGPWKDQLEFDISPLSDGGGYLVSDYFSGPVLTGSQQHFWINSTDQTLTYCGLLKTGFWGSTTGPIQFLTTYMPSMSTSTKSVFCSIQNPSQEPMCSSMQYTFDLVTQDQLDVTVLISDPVEHLSVSFSRKSSEVKPVTALPHKCTLPSLTPSGAEVEVTSGCPYHQAIKAAEAAKTRDLTSTKCFILNPGLNVTLGWEFNTDQSELTVRVSAPVSHGVWLAVGFEPTFPWMQDADIVLGYVASNGQSCVRTMYIEEKVGTPTDSKRLGALSGTSVSEVDGTLQLEFTRSTKPTNGAHPIALTSPPDAHATPLFMWAFGPEGSPMADCTSSPPYHGPTRGLRPVDWVNPANTFSPYQFC